MNRAAVLVGLGTGAWVSLALSVGQPWAAAFAILPAFRLLGVRLATRRPRRARHALPARTAVYRFRDELDAMVGSRA